jgi:FMN reductase
MSYVVSLSGSPAARSRSSHLLGVAESALRLRGVAVRRIDARDLPPAALMHADTEHPAISAALQLVAGAQALLVATPLYKASYSGLLKSFLDLLPQTALNDKPVLPMATGGSLAHLLALDYALKPVLSSLGARHVLDNVYATERDLPSVEGHYTMTPPIAQRLEDAVDTLHQVLADAADLRLSRAAAIGPRRHGPERVAAPA